MGHLAAANSRPTRYSCVGNSAHDPAGSVSIDTIGNESMNIRMTTVSSSGDGRIGVFDVFQRCVSHATTTRDQRQQNIVDVIYHTLVKRGE